jgi:Kdo2-lipid IVA lauroyltransferase/acyltransferase
MTRLVLGLMWLMHLLPFRALAVLGQVLGLTFYVLGRKRRRVALTNLRLCFPDLGRDAVTALARRHFQALGRSVLDHAILWWAPPERVARFVRLEGREHLEPLAGRPVILLAPHFVGLDMGGASIALDYAAASMYSPQKNKHFDAALLRGRLRFTRPQLFRRQDGMRPVIRAIRDGLPFYYLPDMDLGPRDAVFVPFFGVNAATVTALARIAALAGAVVVPCVTRQLPVGAGYVARLYPPWQGFPQGDPQSDARRMNAFIEERVREMPEQYYWVHKRFKTRPPGEASPYEP